MKLLISFISMVSFAAQANVIRLSYPSQQRLHAEHIFQIMQSEHHIPKEFIELVSSSQPCHELRQSKSWHLCINDNGDLQEVAVDISFIQETLRVFL